MTLQEHIENHIELLAQTDELFAKIKSSHGHLMPCSSGCDDCCSVLFRLSFIEAFYINGMFHRCAPDSIKKRVLDRIAQSEPLFRDALDVLAGTNQKEPDHALETASKLRLPCPFKEDHNCVLYEHRPVTCRLYGTPQKIQDRVVSCPKTGFKIGENYMAVDINRMRILLDNASEQFLKDMLEVNTAGAGPIFTLPQAIMTDFNRTYFGKLREIFA